MLNICQNSQVYTQIFLSESPVKKLTIVTVQKKWGSLQPARSTQQQIINVSYDSVLPFHHVRPAACQAKDKGSHPLPNPEDWSKAHSIAGHSLPAKLTAEVQSMVSHHLPDLMLGDLEVGQTSHSTQQTEWTGCDAHLALRVWCMFPLEINKTILHCHGHPNLNGFHNLRMFENCMNVIMQTGSRKLENHWINCNGQQGHNKDIRHA